MQLFVASQGIYAQRTITGKIINGKNELGMAGISVVIKGTTIATTTDGDGNFALRVPSDAIIEVSFIGFKTVETPVVNKTWYEIVFQPDI